MPIIMVFPFLGKEFDRPHQPLAMLDGLVQALVAQLDIQEIGLPPQLSRRMGVGIGDQVIAVQGRQPPVHRRIRGQSRLHRMDIRRQVLKAFLHAVEPRKSPEQRKMGRPDVRRHKDRPWTDLQGDLQQVPAVQSQDRPAVGMDVPNGLQLLCQQIRLLQSREQDHVMHLPHFSIFLIDRADLSGDHEPGLPAPGRPRSHRQLVLQRIKPFLRRDQLFSQLLPPGRMGKIPGPHQIDALSPGPEIQLLRRQIQAGRPGIPGMDV